MAEYFSGPLQRGDVVIVIAFRGQRLQRRVWEESGYGVLLCSEEQYRHALRTGEEPLAAGFPKQDVVEVFAQSAMKDSVNDKRADE